MDKVEKKKVLIVGSGASAYATAYKFSQDVNIEEVYVAPGNAAMSEFASIVDIREDNVDELLVFVLKNNIDLTVAVSAKAVKADIAGLFQANSQDIFAPAAISAEFALSRSNSKRFLYKQHIPTPRFGIFEKSSLALDYVSKAQMPVVITSNEVTDASVLCACSTVDSARRCIEDMVLNNEDKIILEEYLQGHNFTVYVITDGYHVLPLAVCAEYKFLEDGDGGLLTCGMGAFVPDYKVSRQVIDTVMENVRSILASLENKGTPYLGILGVECVLLDNDNFVTTGFSTFLKDDSAQAVLNTLDDNLYILFKACAIGSFADDYEQIATKGTASVSAVLYSRDDGNIITGLDLTDDATAVSHFSTSKNELFEYLTNKGRTLVVTQEGATLSSARRLLYENIDIINFKGKKFRSDICN